MNITIEFKKEDIFSRVIKNNGKIVMMGDNVVMVKVISTLLKSDGKK